MKKTLLLLLSCFFSAIASAQTEPAVYKSNSEKLRTFYDKDQADSLYQLFGKVLKAAVPEDKTGLMITQLKGQLGALKQLQFDSLKTPVAFYNAAFEKGNFIMSLVLDDENKINGFYFKPAPAVTKPVAAGLKETPFEVNTTDASLSGSLVIPEKTNSKIPVVLIIAGSGPTDRDGNGLGFNANSYFMLANVLGKAGIASVRYDKRGIGKSSTKKSINDVRFDDFVNDADALIRSLKADSRFSKVIVLGHSEGSLIGMIAAEKEKVDGFISLAGAGDKANKVITEQYKAQPKEIFTTSKAKLDSLAKGLNVSANNDPMFASNLQPYMISWMKYDPQTEIKKLQIPVLIVQGTNDLQVSVADAKKLKKVKPDAKLVIIDGVNHVLKPAPYDREKNVATYNQPLLPLDSNLINAVVGFVKAQ